MCAAVSAWTTLRLYALRSPSLTQYSDVMPFFSIAAGLIGKLVMSVASRDVGEKIKDFKTQRRMGRLVDDAVDRIVEQAEGYLRAEKVSESRQEILIAALCDRLQQLVDEPQRMFTGDLDGATIFKQAHPQGELPRAILEEDLGQFYTVLFPQIAHFVAGSRVALGQWQAEGFREEFKRLTQLAEELRAMNAKVADVPAAVVGALADRGSQRSDTVLREFAQTLLNNLLLRLDLSPLRAERALHGSLADHFVVPAVRVRNKTAEVHGKEDVILEILTSPGARRVLHGGPGVGKTTACLWLQSRLLQDDPSRLAIVFRLRETSNIEHHSLLDLLRDRAGIHLRDAINDKILREWHAAGRLCVILDGFDELPEHRRDAVQQWVKDLSVVAKKTTIIVTSRPLQSGHLDSLRNRWQHWDLLPFDEERIVEFIDRWHRYLPDSELSQTERQIDSWSLAHTFFNDPSIKPLAETPLMLGTLLFVHHRDKKLPSGRVDLYERYIAAMLGLRDSGLGIEARATKLTDKEKRKVLAHVALHFHLNEVNEVTDNTMHQLVADVLIEFNLDENIDHLLAALHERTGLLQGPGAWSFMHKTIGEFLVAELVCDGTTRLQDSRRLDRKELWNHRYDDSWTAVLFFWAGKASARELEELVIDLVAEQTLDGTLLALGLLHDQGDRLTHSSQRKLALDIIRFPQPERPNEKNHWFCPVPVVPKLGTRTFHSYAADLRGFSSVDAVDAYKRLFSRAVLVPNDIVSCDKGLLKQLMVAVVWPLDAFGADHMLEVRRIFANVQPGDMAVYFFFSLAYRMLVRRRTEREAFKQRLGEWAMVFPEGESWLPFLLAGFTISMKALHGGEASAVESTIGPILYDLRSRSVDVDWLRTSDESEGWLSDTVDLLEEFDARVRAIRPNEWGLTAEQHQRLIEWILDLKSQRTSLKLAVET